MINLAIIEEKMENIINEGWSDGMSVYFGNSNNSYSIVSGHISSSPSFPLCNTTLFDLASVTKIFTLVTVMKLVEQNILDLNAPIKMYTNHFPNISEIKIFELMNFSKQLCTTTRLENYSSVNDALSTLKNIQYLNSSVKYTDMGAIVLSQIVNEVLHNSNGFKLFSKDLWASIGLTNTYWWNDIPSEMLKYTQNYDSEFKIINGDILKVQTAIGTVHDKKAQILGACGHAGIFSTPYDISIFARKLLSGEILSQASIDTLTSDKYNSYAPNQTFGLLCYKKHPDIKQSEIPFLASDNSIAISGYTGTYLLLDFTNKIYIFIGANRLYHRLTYTDISLDNEKSACFLIKNNVKYVKDYVYKKDIIRDLCFSQLIN